MKTLMKGRLGQAFYTLFLLASGMMSGIFWVITPEEFDYSSRPCMVDLEEMPHQGPWPSAPARAWKRRQRALEEVSANPWSIITDEEFAYESYRQRTAPSKMVAGVVSTTATAALTTYMARSA